MRDTPSLFHIRYSDPPPKTLQKLEVVGNHIGHWMVPFGLFAPQPVAGIAGLLMVIHQVWLVFSGNFAWLNWLTIALAIMAFDDAQLRLVLPLTAPVLEAPRVWYTAVLIAGT